MKDNMSSYKNKIRRKRYRGLNNGKRKGLNLVELLKLNFLGRRDGRKGLPRTAEDNVWGSPFIDSELQAYEEFCSRTWGGLQIENEDRYARLEELTNILQSKEKLLKDARSELSELIREENLLEPVRKRGEDKLTEAQVKARRYAEREKRMLPIRRKVTCLEGEIETNLEEFAELHSGLLEDDNSTRLICNRVKDHVLMRMDTYWNAALLQHREGNSMPTVPLIDFKNAAEEIYMKPHKELMARANNIYEVVKKMNDENLQEVV